ASRRRWSSRRTRPARSSGSSTSRSPTSPAAQVLRVPRAMTQHRQSLGESGENLAVRELTARGYAILARRYRTRHGEIDIIAEHEGTIVFVEVRARATAEFGRAAESVTDAKKRKATAMAVDYLARHHLTNRAC